MGRSLIDANRKAMSPSSLNSQFSLHRAQLPGFELPEPVRAAQQQFDYRAANVLDDIADRLEGKASREKDNLEDSFEQLQETVRSCSSLEPQQPRAQQTFLTLSRNIESLTISLSKEI
jgi:hypothetical protein